MTDSPDESGTARRPAGPVEPTLLRRIPELRTHLGIVSAVAVVMAVAVITQAEVLARGVAHLVGATPDGPSNAQMIGALVAVGAVRAATAFVIERSAASTMAAARRRVRSAVIDHAIAGGDRAAPGLGSREATVATTGVEQLEPYVRTYLPALTQAVVLPFAAGVRIAMVDWLSAVIVMLTVPLIPIFMVLIGKLTERRTRRSWALLQRLGGHFLDVLEGLPTLRLFGRADAQAAQVHKVSEDYRTATMGTLRVAMLSALALELLATLSVAVVAVAIGLRLLSGGLTLATGLVVLLLVPECYLPLRRVGASFHAAQNGLDAAADLDDLLDRPVPPTGSMNVPDEPTIEVHDLVVQRRGASLTLDTDLRASPGGLVAITGPSGSGKTTVLDAVRGRLVGRTGVVSVGGVDVHDLDPDEWSERLTVATQLPEPLGASVIDEIVGTDAELSPFVSEALEAVGLSGFAERRPNELSGGQLRRVHVARLIATVRAGRASVVLADEPTAQLDEVAARRVRSALRALADEHDAIVVVATHDAAFAAIADQVVGLAPIGRATSADASADETAVAATEPRHVEPRRATIDASNDAGPPLERDRPALQLVLHTARPARRRLIGAAALGSLAEICTLGLAGFAAWLIVRASEQPEISAVALVVTGVRAFGTGKGVFRYAERLASHDAGLRALAELRTKVVERLAAMPPGALSDLHRADVATRVVDDIDRLLDLFVRVLVPTISIAVATALTLLVTMVIDPRAALVLLLGLAVVSVAIPAVTFTAERRRATVHRQAATQLRAAVLDTTEHADLLVAQRGVAARMRDVVALGRQLDRIEHDRATTRAWTAAALAAAPVLVTAATLAVIGNDAAAIGTPLFGVLVLWPLASIELNAAIDEATASLPAVGAAARRVAQVLDVGAEQRGDDDLVGSAPRVDLTALRATWPSTGHGVGPVDAHLSFGARSAITGPSGSGKSTLAASLVRFCPITSGTYRLGDVVATDAASDVVRRVVTWVDQTPWIADTSIRENLRIAGRTASDTAMVDALRAVALDDWFAALPDGLDTLVGRHGAAMSGGEAHRLALARVLLAHHDVVVLDEPTSHLDAATARTVVAGVAAELDGRTVVVLAHDDPPAGFTRVAALQAPTSASAAASI
ncbi:MAG: thiol reductant ABC exporter subunit CydD [Actinomycetota bacterium]